MLQIVFATDGSSGAGIAEELISSIPWPQDATFSVVSVARWASGITAAAWPIATETTAIFEEHRLAAAESVARGAAERLRSALGERAVRWDVLRGQPAATITELARLRGADLVVVGSRGLGAIEGALLGSVSAAIADHAPCPVLVARSARLARSVIADDGSPGAATAVAYVCRRPWLLGHETRLLAVHLSHETWAEAMDLPFDPVAWRHFDDERTERIAKTRSRLAGRASDLVEAGCEAMPVTEIAEGRPASAIVDAAAASHADLVVIGSRHRTGDSRFGFASVGRHVLNHAPCSVLLVGRIQESAEGLDVVVEPLAGAAGSGR